LAGFVALRDISCICLVEKESTRQRGLELISKDQNAVAALPQQQVAGDVKQTRKRTTGNLITN